MLRKVSFALFDTGETILGALVFSTLFPLYITQHLDTKVYSFLYGLSFLLSFGLALYMGKLADEKGLRKHLFLLFGALVALLCISISLALSHPYLALALFLVMAVMHQQAFIFYNSLLLNFEKDRGFVSGLGVAFGYVGSAVALLFLADILEGKGTYLVVGLLFLFFLILAGFGLNNPPQRDKVSLRDIFKDKRFLLLVASILAVTEVANTLIAMMGIYLREVFSLSSEYIYRTIGLSATGGILGGLLWGKLTDLVGVKRVFPAGFFLWIFFLLTLPLASGEMVLLWGFIAGLSLSHLWTTSRLLILKSFPEAQASVRLSFLSITERIASTTGLILWSFLLLVTGDNFKLSAVLMAFLPLIGFFIYRAIMSSHDASPDF